MRCNGFGFYSFNTISSHLVNPKIFKVNSYTLNNVVYQSGGDLFCSYKNHNTTLRKYFGYAGIINRSSRRSLSYTFHNSQPSTKSNELTSKDNNSPETSSTKLLYKDQNDTWVDRHVPSPYKYYLKLARADRPIGTYLLLLPCTWSIMLGSPAIDIETLKLLGIFTAGAFLMRSAGCTVNDLWDRNFDRQVARTSQRPVASGKISVCEGIAFLGMQLSLALTLLLQLDQMSVALGAASLIPVVGYPLAKRVMRWPQLVLGLTINWGALLGFVAASRIGDARVIEFLMGREEFCVLQEVPGFASIAVPLYMGGVFWTLVYDTIYAHQDKADDRKLGLGSTALTIGDKNTKPALAGFAATSLALWYVAGMNAGLGNVFNASLGIVGLHYAWQIATADLNDRTNLTSRFVSNQYLGAILLSGIVLDKMLI